jgi:hypothetical protein
VRPFRLVVPPFLIFLLLPFAAEAQAPPAEQAQSQAPKAHVNESPYTPITRQERFKWFVYESIGPTSIAFGVANSAYNTALDDPYEYRGTWSGFGKRFGIRESTVSLGNAIEAGLGSIWGEDPRYFRAPERPFKGRVGNIIRQTLLAKYPDGRFGPAYARYTGIVGNNFISNAWRAPSESGAGDALTRVGWGFVSRMGSNAFVEFWPDVKRRVFQRRN